MAERSYPKSELRAGSQEEIPSIRGQGRQREEEPPHAPKPEARGSWWEELPHAPKPEAKGQWGGAIPRPRPGAVAGKTNPTSKELWLRGRRRA